LALVGAYALPAIAIWTVLGLLAGKIGGGPVWTSFGVAYALIFAVIQALRLRVTPPTSKWQVPASWVAGRSATGRLAVWGMTLGPGLMTLNLYATMWLLPTFLGYIHGYGRSAVIGALVGLAHGAARALGIADNMIRRDSSVHAALLGLFRWRFVDAIALAAAAGVLATWL